jgi:hypothetical protein
VGSAADPRVLANPVAKRTLNCATSRERGAPGFEPVWGFGLIDAYAAAQRACQVGNSPLYWVCLPGRRNIQLIVPEFLIPASLALGLDFGRCD